MSNALQQAFEMLQDTPAYGNASKWASQLGVHLPQQKLISPLPDNQMPGGYNDPTQPGLAAYYRQNSAAEMAAHKNNAPVAVNKTLQYPAWMANAAPQQRIPVGSPKISPTAIPIGQAKPSPTAIPVRQPVSNGGQYPEFQNFTTAPIPQDLQALIYNAAQKAGVHPAVLASLLFSEHGLQADQNKTFNRDAQGNIIPNNYDRGIAQINSIAHPDITDQQAFDPNFAVPYAARLLAAHIKAMNGDINRGIAAYNVGEGGAAIKGPTPSGLGPRGQAYLNKVAAGLSPALRSKLGIIYAQ